MNFKIRNQNGFGHAFTVVLLAVVIAVVAYAGLRVYDMKNTPTSTPVNNLPVASTAVPGTIKTKADLQQAQRALDTTTAPDPSVLNNDIKNLL